MATMKRKLSPLDDCYFFLSLSPTRTHILSRVCVSRGSLEKAVYVLGSDGLAETQQFT